MTRQERLKMLENNARINEENYRTGKITQEQYQIQKKDTKLRLSELRKTIRRTKEQTKKKLIKKLIEEYESASMGYEHISDCSIKVTNIRCNEKDDTIFANVTFSDSTFNILHKQQMKYSLKELERFQKEHKNYDIK